MEELARLVGVTRTFVSDAGPVPVLRGVDLTVHAGDLLRIRGPSGAGKTTLLSILGLLDADYGGSFRFAGQEANAASERTRAAWRLAQVGFAFQDLHLVPSLSSRDNVALVGSAAGQTDAAARTRAGELLAAAGLGHRLDHAPGALSGGERRRVALARSLMNRPRLLLLDEPTAGLDAAAAEGMAVLVRDAAAAGTAVVAASHDPTFPGPGFRELALRDGRLVAA